MPTATSSLSVQNYFETTLSGSISASDTTIGVNAVPTGSEGYLIIEPDSSTNREVVYYTSKTSNSVVLTSALNGRGKDGTTAQSHASGATVRMQITSSHWLALQDMSAVTPGSVTPEKLLAGAGTSWAWQSWTPTFTNWTIGTGGSAQTVAKYVQIGKTVYFKLNTTLGTSGASVGTPVKFTLPVTATALSTTGTASMPIGLAHYEDTGNTNYQGSLNQTGTTEATCGVFNAGGTYLGSQTITSTIPFTWAPGDSINCYGSYEAA